MASESSAHQVGTRVDAAESARRERQLSRIVDWRDRTSLKFGRPACSESERMKRNGRMWFAEKGSLCDEHESGVPAYSVSKGTLVVIP